MSAVWLIVLMVLLGVEAAFIYVANQEATQAKENLDSMSAERNRFEGLFQTEATKAIEVSDALGFRDPSDPGSVSNLDAFRESLRGLQAVFPDIGSATSFQEIVQPITTAYNTQLQKVATLQQEVTGLQGQVAAKDAANRTLETNLQAEITRLNSEKQDAEQNAAAEKADLERRLAEMTTKYTQSSDSITEWQNRYDDLEQEKQRAALAAQTRMLTINSQLDNLRHQSEQPDARILSVSKSLNIGWINRGSIDRVAEGMVFEVRTGNPNPTRDAVKGYAEVTAVESDRAQVRFFDQADDVDPPVTGDLVFNPVYEPSGVRYAVLAGNFTGRFNESETKLLLEEIGIQVQESLDLTTNYLIVGGPMYRDQDGEPVSDPIQPSELPVYKDAQAYGCAIITINDLRKFFRR